MFDKKLLKKFDSIAKEKAKIQEKENSACQEFMKATSPETICNVFDIIDKFGHPIEQEQAKHLKNKYESKDEWSFEEIITLDALYKSSFNHMNKGDCDE